MQQEYKKQPLTYDSQVYIWTIVYCIAMLPLAYAGLRYTEWWVVVLLIFVGVMTLFFIATMPRAFQETESEYIVHLLLYKARFPKSEYTAEVVDKSILKDSVRTFATGGAFGYTGFWWSPVLRNFYAMFSNPNAPLLKLSKKVGKGKRTRVYLTNGSISSPQI